MSPRQRAVTQKRRRRKTDRWMQPMYLSALRTVIQGAGLVLLLHFNATHFDSGEVKTVVGASLVTVALEALGIRRNGNG